MANHIAQLQGITLRSDDAFVCLVFTRVRLVYAIMSREHAIMALGAWFQGPES
jgi:hypothetical protein